MRRPLIFHIVEGFQTKLIYPYIFLNTILLFDRCVAQGCEEVGQFTLVIIFIITFIPLTFHVGKLVYLRHPEVVLLEINVPAAEVTS